MSKDTIQEDVSEVEKTEGAQEETEERAEEAEERQPTARDMRMNDIVAQNRRARGGDDEDEAEGEPEQTEQESDEGNESEDAGEEPESDDAPGDESDAPRGDGTVFEKGGKYYANVKINGQAQVVPIEKVLMEYQKSGAGDEKLRVAAQKERQLAEYEQRLMQEARALQARNNQPSGGKTDAGSSHQGEPSANTADAQDAVVSAIYDGDENAAKQALSDFRAAILAEAQQASRGQQRDQPVDPRQVASEVKRITDVETAQEAFRRNFPEVAADQHLYDMAGRFSQQLLDTEPHLSAKENLQRAGEMVNEWLGQHGNKGGDQPTRQSERQGRKRQSASRMTGGNTRRASIGTDAPAPKSKIDIINEMRSRRGQPVS